MTAPKKHWIVKVGSNTLMGTRSPLDRLAIASLARDIAWLIDQGTHVTLVSSGAVALGRALVPQAPAGRDVATLQAMAALGQPGLMRTWTQELGHYGLTAAQLLLGRHDLSVRSRYLNARATLTKLQELGAVVVINENDSVATEELRFGDNDRLAAMACGITGADLLVILSDVDGVYDRDAHGELTHRLASIDLDDPRLELIAGGPGSSAGTGGMASKVAAARIAARFGVPTWVGPGAHIGALRLLWQADQSVGTWLNPAAQGAVTGKRAWIGAGAAPKGQITCDEGAIAALRARGASLLPRGVTAVLGEFDEGDVVELVGPEGDVVALGVSRYRAQDARKVCGLRTDEIAQALGYHLGDALVHRDDLVML